MGDIRKKGMATRREVLGNAHVDRAEQNKTSFDEPFSPSINASTSSLDNLRDDMSDQDFPAKFPGFIAKQMKYSVPQLRHQNPQAPTACY